MQVKLDTSLISSIYNRELDSQLIVSVQLHEKILNGEIVELTLHKLYPENFPYGSPTGITIKAKFKDE